MSPYLAELHDRLRNEEPSVLAWELEQAFAEALADNPTWASPRVLELHGLLRFCKFDALAPWLAHERETLAQVLAFAQRIGDERVGRILAEALAGKTQGDASFSVTLPDGATHALDVDVGEVTRHAGQDWGGTDIALSLVMNDFTVAVVREVAAAADELALEAPRAERAKSAATRAAEARARTSSAASLFEDLVSARKPGLEVGDWDAFEARRVGGNTLIAITHEANPPAAPTAVQAMTKKYGDAARELLSLCERHNGAALFQHGSTCGFYIAAIEEWDELLGRALDWAEQVTWQDEPDEIPACLRSAIAFGVIPGDSEVWLLITEGEHAGKVMLSDTDLIEDRARYASITEFVATLIEDPARVLNSGGYVRYVVGDQERYAVRYLSDRG